MSEKLINICSLQIYAFVTIPLEMFDTLTVEPIPHIHDNKYEDDAEMIEATFQHMKYHFNRKRGDCDYKNS